MPIETVEPRRLYRQVAEQLRSLMDSGEFAVGARLPAERDLAMQLGVSRPTVREALIALEVDGRVRIRVGSGIYVLPRPSEALPVAATPIAGPFAILEARALFEGAIAYQAGGIATATDIDKLDAILDGMRRTRHPDPQSIAADRAFHMALADILGNDAVTKVVGDLFDQRINPYYAQLARHFENAGSWGAALEEHQIIRDCLAGKDAEGARVAMQMHLQKSQIRFSRTFGEAPAAPPKRTEARPVTMPRVHATVVSLNHKKLSQTKHL
jgi:DNA-binding FadR family transcriptional regulator